MFGQKRWIILFAKCRSFALFKTTFFWSKKSFFFYPQHQKTIFSDLISPKKKQLRKISIFGQKPWILALHRTVPFWSKNHSFLAKIYKKKTIFSDLIIPKNPKEKKFDLKKTMGYPLKKMLIFFSTF